MSQQLTQIPSLSNPCNKVIVQYNNFLIKEIKEEEFWESIQEFYKVLRSYPEKIGAKVGIQSNIKKINDLFVIIHALRLEREEASRTGQPERALRLSMNIEENYNLLDHEVRNLQEKAQRGERQMGSAIGLDWVVSFFSRYYHIISASGSLEDIVTTMKTQLTSANARIIKGCFTIQKTKLDDIAPMIKNLNNVNQEFPDDLRQRVLNIDKSVSELIDLYRDKTIDLNDKVDRVLDFHKNFKQELKYLYEDTIERIVMR